MLCPSFTNIRCKLECLFLASLSILVYFWVRSGAYPSGAPEECFTQVSSGFTHKHYDKLEKLSRDKHSSLFTEFVNNGCKKLCNNGPWSKGYKTFYGRNSQIYVISLSVCPLWSEAPFIFTPLQRRLLALPTNIKLGLKDLPETNTLAHC